jgi:hypothetical protein
MHIILEPCGTQQVKFDRCTRVKGASGQSTGPVVIGNGQKGIPGRGVGDQNWHINQRYGNMWKGLGGAVENADDRRRTEVNARPSSQQLCRRRSAWRLLFFGCWQGGKTVKADGTIGRKHVAEPKGKARERQARISAHAAAMAQPRSQEES